MRLTDRILLPTAVVVALLAPLFGTEIASAAARSGPERPAWPAPPESARVVFVGELRGEADLRPRAGLLTRLLRGLTGSRGRRGVVLARPSDVYAPDSSRVFVSDASAGAAYLFDYRSGRATRLGAEGSGRLDLPLGMGGDGRGHVYVTDAAARRVVEFDLEGRYSRTIGAPGELLNPVDVALDPADGSIWVVDSHYHQVVVFDSAGAVRQRIGRHEGLPPEPSAGVSSVATRAGVEQPADGFHGPSRRARDVIENRGAGQGEFLYPVSITRSADGRFHVSDGLNGRVQSFDRFGHWVSGFGSLGDTPGSLPRPKGVAADSDGHLHVVDAAFNNLQLFDPDGRLLLAVGGLGNDPGRFWLPLGIHIDPNDRIYVADRYNGRVQILQYLTTSVTDSRGPGSEDDSHRAPREGRP